MLIMRSDDLYPSTHDCVLDITPMAGGSQEADEDLVMGCLINARARVKLHHTREEYVGHDGAVCPIGAVLAVDGFKPCPRFPGDWDEELRPKFLPRYLQGGALLKTIEQEMSEEAQTAIALLNAAALELHPEAVAYSKNCWSGPLEWVNQEWRLDEEMTEQGRDRVIKKEILRIYDHAINQRMGGVLA